MKHTYTIYLFLLLAIAAISAEGCSLIGYAIGSRIDDDHKVSHDTTAAFTQPLFGDIGDNTGMFARIQYNDSTVRYASFEGYTDEPDSAYRARWDSFLRMHPNSPEPFKFGDSIIAGKGNDDHKYVGQFTGYSLDGIDLSFLHTGSVLLLQFSSYDYAGVPGKENSLPAAQTAFDSNAVPVRAILRFADQQKLFTLTNSDFYNAKFIEGNASTVGLAIGAAIDIAMIILAVEYRPFLSGLGNFSLTGH